MGWKGTLRSVTAAARAAEREAQRRHKQALKDQMVAEAAEAVENWEQYVETLVSIHKNLADPINWHKTAGLPKPVEPSRQSTHQDAAYDELKRFRPSLFHIFQGGWAGLRKKLKDALAQASKLDEREYEEAKAQYTEAVAEWEADTELARRLLNGEAEALLEVIQESKLFDGEGLVGSAVAFSISDGLVHARPEVHSDDIVPNFRRKQLASGRLSETDMPAGQFNELYQDYVASVALKVAGDFLRILPVNEVYVTCMTQMLNTQTGHQEPTPILSVQFVRETMDRMNFARVDPSDALSNFNHTMNFKKTKGFASITPLQPIE